MHNNRRADRQTIRQHCKTRKSDKTNRKTQEQGGKKEKKRPRDGKDKTGKTRQDTTDETTKDKTCPNGYFHFREMMKVMA
jgi:hypothetical protein